MTDTDMLGFVGLGSLMEKTQYPGSLECLFYIVEQGERIMYAVEQGDGVILHRKTRRQGYYIHLSRTQV